MKSMLVLASAMLALVAAAAQPAAARDVKNTEQGRQVEKALAKAALGNASSAKLHKLDLGKGKVKGKATIHHKHVWVVKTPFGKTRVTAYSQKTKITLDIDLRKGKVSGEIDLGRGVKVSLDDIARLLLTLL